DAKEVLSSTAHTHCRHAHTRIVAASIDYGVRTSDLRGQAPPVVFHGAEHSGNRREPRGAVVRQLLGASVGERLLHQKVGVVVVKAGLEQVPLELLRVVDDLAARVVAEPLYTLRVAYYVLSERIVKLGDAPRGGRTIGT